MSTGAGEYRHPVVIERESPVAEADNVGHVDLSIDANWTKFISTRARVMTVGGREFQRAQQTRADLSTLLRIRYSTRAAQITSKMRVIHKQRQLNILSVFDVNDAGIEIELACKEQV